MDHESNREQYTYEINDRQNNVGVVLVVSRPKKTDLADGISLVRNSMAANMKSYKMEAATEAEPSAAEGQKISNADYEEWGNQREED